MYSKISLAVTWHTMIWEIAIIKDR